MTLLGVFGRARGPVKGSPLALAKLQQKKLQDVF